MEPARLSAEGKWAFRGDGLLDRLRGQVSDVAVRNTALAAVDHFLAL